MSGLRQCGIYAYTHTHTHTHTHTKYYSVIKKNEILSFTTTWMKLEDIMLSERSQTKRYMWFQLYVKSKKQTKTAETDP